MSRRIRTLISTWPIASFAGLLLVGLTLGFAGCGADSPSEPSQQPGTPPGTGPSNATCCSCWVTRGTGDPRS